MEVQIIDKQTLSYFESMLSTILTKVDVLAEENKKLKSDRLMSLKEVCEYTGFGEAWVLRHKDQIGYSQIGCKDLRFRKEHIDNYFNNSKHFIKAKY